MKHIRKKLAVGAVLMAMCTGMMAPKTAEASVRLWDRINGEEGEPNYDGAVFCLLGGCLAAFVTSGAAVGIGVVSIIGIASGDVLLGIGGLLLTGGLVVLNEEEGIPVKEFTAMLQYRYPALDQGSAQSLANLAKVKIQTSPRDEEGHQEIRFTRDEVSSAIASSGMEELNEEEFHQLVHDLE